MTKSPEHQAPERRPEASRREEAPPTPARTSRGPVAHAPDCAPGQRGYALVALLALMTIILIVTMSAAPSIRQQTRRDLEREAIARGEEVAEAIRAYIHMKGAPPTSMDELLDGVTPPGSIKKKQVLRASAARDPLSKDGEWRLIKANDREFAEFIRAVTLYSEGRLPPTNDQNQFMRAIEGTFRQFISILNTGSGEDAPGGEDTSLSSNGPFIGVASRSRRASVLTYYDIERHDKWVFTPFFK
jgi:type II secretory pathway pseudopilin PulG